MAPDSSYISFMPRLFSDGFLYFFFFYFYGTMSFDMDLEKFWDKKQSLKKNTNINQTS